MTPAEIVSILGLPISVLIAFGVPYVTNRRKNRTEDAKAINASWNELNEALRNERDRSESKLEAVEAKYVARLNSMEADYSKQISEARERIRQLESEVTALYIQLGRSQLS